MSEHPETGSDREPEGNADDRSGSRGARLAWSSTGITFFMVGVVFTVTMPDNIALGITFLAVGVVFFSLAGSPRAPGDGPGASPEAGPGESPEAGTGGAGDRSG